MRRRPQCLILLGVLVAACATLPVEGKIVVSGQGFEVNPPQGWYLLQRLRPEESPVLLTTDGLRLQFIRVGRRPVENGFLYSGKRLPPGLSPQEAAALQVDDLRAARLIDLEIVESAPASVGGKAGFKLVYTWKTSEGLRMKQSEYGLVVGPWLYQLTYQAAARYYFERDLTAFERVVASFRLLGNS